MFALPGQLEVSRKVRLVFDQAHPASPQLIAIDLEAEHCRDEYVSVRDAGAWGDGSRDDSAAVQAAYDRLVKRGGGVLYFAPGAYRVLLTLTDRSVALRGAGSSSSFLRPVKAGDAVVQGAYRSAQWSYVTIQDLAIEGGGLRGITGFRAGLSEPRPGDPFAGRTRFVNVAFRNLATCVHRPAGQIGLMIEDCEFGSADVHIRSHDAAAPPTEMHAGNIYCVRTHFSGARQAVFHFSGRVTGNGQISFENCIMESNPGFVFFVDGLNSQDSVPGMTVSSCWNEENGTAPSVTMEPEIGPVQPVYGLFRDAAFVRFIDTPLGNLVLTNSVIQSERCPLDRLRSAKLDRRSTLRHFEARGFGSYHPIGVTTGIAAAYQNDPPGRALSFAVPPPNQELPINALNWGLGSRGQARVQLSGSRAITTEPGSRSDGRLFQRASLQAGDVVMPAPVDIAPCWLIWLYIYRLPGGVSVDLAVAGHDGIALYRPLDGSGWQAIAGIAEVAKTQVGVSFWHRANREGLLDIGGFHLLCFPTREEATSCLNSDSLRYLA